jgi:CRISPR-associated protein Csm4
MAIFDLTLRGWLHINENASSSREATLEWIPSDTLFSALVSTWAAQGVDVEQRLDSFLGEAAPPFKITSLFPRAGKVRFYPAPPRLPSYAQEQVSDGKSLRKIRWISQGVLDALSNADPLEGKRNLIHHSTVWLTSAELASVGESLPEEEDGDVALWKKQIVPRVVVDRQSQASNLFHTGRVSFGEGCGLWFAVSGEAEWVRGALLILQDNGLGGLRSLGHGQFSFNETQSELPQAKQGWGYLLSRYAPATSVEIMETLQASASAYRFTTVGGWCQDDLGHAWRRRSMRMVEEGALLPAQARGCLRDLRPLKPEEWLGEQRPVWRYGLAYLISAGRLVEAA